jgi:hypothetical protein
MHGAAAEVTQEVINRCKTFQKILVRIAFGYGCLLQFSRNPAEPDFLRAYKIAGVAPAAEPDQIRGEHLFSHAKDNHVDEAARIKITNNLPDRAYTGARTTGVAGFYLLQPYL